MSDSVPQSPPSDAEWNDLLCQLHAQSQVRPQPFFYSRLHARLMADAPAKNYGLPLWLRRPAYAALLGALVMALSGDGATLRPAGEATRSDAVRSGR